MKLKNLAILGAALLALSSAPAFALDTLIQYSTDGTGDGTTDGAAGGYDITGVNEFDWQSSGDLVIVDALPFDQTLLNGVTCSTFSCFALNAQNGDSITFNSEVHARLNDMLDNGGDSVAPDTLSTDGGTTNLAGDACNGTNCFEITAAASLTETATFFGGTLIFTSVSGTYEFLHDSTPDSSVTAGTGYTDGVTIISGTVECDATKPNCGTFTAGVGGSVFFANTVTNYDDSYIQTDPTAYKPLSETTFDTLVQIISDGEAAVSIPGGIIGLNEYTTVTGDLGFKADANSEFAANPERVPEPTTLALVGVGLLGMAGMRRRRSS